MPPDYLHNHPDFPDLIRIVAEKKGVDPALVEKDYWIMHCLYGLQKRGLTFELKGGTSLSKGFRIIDRFSEDIDIRIEPPPDRDVKTGPNQDKPAHRKSREDFYDWLAGYIQIDGIAAVERDREFDNATFFSGGIRLIYKPIGPSIAGLKQGVLLEVGFDDARAQHPRRICVCKARNISGAQYMAYNMIIHNNARYFYSYLPVFTLNYIDSADGVSADCIQLRVS
jgi:hypothetical protein